MERKRFKVIVFGKEGCPKCHVLNQRIDKLLKKDSYQDFEKEYVDILTEDGLIEFCSAECINPQRIPAMAVKIFDPKQKYYRYIANPLPGTNDAVCGNSRLYTLLGVQTDYTSSGIITADMIKHILEGAREAAPV
jgi:hypothetical protein